MKVLIAHNHYQQPGGEDTVFAAEVALLRAAGHDVQTLTVSNDAIGSAMGQLRAALQTPYSFEGRALMEKAIFAFQPDIVHVHNVFPRLSPSIFDACVAARVPSVLTLHNFRITCANALLMRDGAVCEQCLGKAPLPAIQHRCYRGSLAGSAALAASIWFNAVRGTWTSKVGSFIALTEFARRKFIAAGLPSDRIVVKPNFIEDPLGSSEIISSIERSGAIFVGRLSPEKGVDILIEAWRNLDIPLSILGDGPMRAKLERCAPPTVQFLGHLEKASVQRALRSASLLIVPSIWYEMFPMTVVEAMALGTPVLASCIGGLEEIVTEGVDGLHFKVGNAGDLSAVVRQAFANPARLQQMGINARSHFERSLSAPASLSLLEQTYHNLISSKVA